MATVDSILDGLVPDAVLIPEHMRPWWTNYLATHRRRYHETVAALALAAGDAVLEIGSVPGHFTALLAGLGAKVTGLDVEPSRCAAFWEKRGIEVVGADIERERLPFPDRSFDKILMTEVLEHLRINPLHALSEVQRVLARGGTLLLSTPNVRLNQRWSFLFGHDYQGDPVEEFEKLRTLGHMGHVRLYSSREVVRMVEHAGMSVRAVQYLGPVVARRLLGLTAAFPAAFREYVAVQATV